MAVSFPSTAPVRIDFEWEEGLPVQINYALMKIESLFEDPRALAVAAKEILIHDMTQKFQTETDPSGDQWQDIAKPEPEQIGILRRGSTDAQMYRDATSDSAWSATPVGVFFDTGALPPYWVHHEQPDLGVYRITRREFVAASNEAQVEITGFASYWLDTEVYEIVQEAQTIRSTGPKFNPRSGRFHDPATGRFTKAPS